MDADPSSQETFFAPAGRAEAKALRDEAELCINSPIARAVLDSLDGFVVVLNAQRQILAANDTLLEALTREGVDNPIGLRWGEASHCVHVPEGPDGCGTSKACRYCGAALTLMAAQGGLVPVAGECRMSILHQGQWEAREFQLKVTPLHMPFGELLIPVFHDVSDTHRREVLESAFLHDMASSLSALSCWSDLLNLGAVDVEAANQKIAGIAAQLSEVVGHQRLLIQAEQGKLPAEAKDLEADPFLVSLQNALAANPVGLGKGLKVEVGPSTGAWVRTDPTLLHRILANMGVNALEAALPGETVTLSCARADGTTSFSVHNPGHIPEAVAAQIFNRSFSTKAKSGRGLGTYAMKLLGENLLGGKVGFRSSPEEGTEFFIRLVS